MEKMALLNTHTDTHTYRRTHTNTHMHTHISVFVEKEYNSTNCNAEQNITVLTYTADIMCIVV